MGERGSNLDALLRAMEEAELLEYDPETRGWDTIGASFRAQGGAPWYRCISPDPLPLISKSALMSFCWNCEQQVALITQFEDMDTTCIASLADWKTRGSNGWKIGEARKASRWMNSLWDRLEPTTIKQAAQALRAWVRWLAYQGIKPNFAHEIPSPRPSMTPQRTFTLEEIRKLFGVKRSARFTPWKNP